MLIWITDPPNIIVPGSVQNGPFGPSTYSLGNGLTAVNTYDTLGSSMAAGPVLGRLNPPPREEHCRHTDICFSLNGRNRNRGRTAALHRFPSSASRAAWRHAYPAGPERQ